MGSVFLGDFGLRVVVRCHDDLVMRLRVVERCHDDLVMRLRVIVSSRDDPNARITQSLMDIAC